MVKQGDVISPILFNAGLEHAMRKWKAKLVHHGVQLGHVSRLTNIRYADDLMLFATSSNDLIYMFAQLGWCRRGRDRGVEDLRQGCGGWKGLQTEDWQRKEEAAALVKRTNFTNTSISY